jgi:histidine triad (HIT) family protein
MDDCIFCKLANGEIPTATLLENDDFRVILDAGPASRGHSLILPKQHFADIFSMPDDLLAKAAVFAGKTSAALKEAMQCDGLNVVQNNGREAGQTVFHFHIHLIPRYAGDASPIAGWVPGTLTEEDKKDILERFSHAVS